MGIRSLALITLSYVCLNSSAVAQSAVAQDVEAQGTRTATFAQEDEPASRPVSLVLDSARLVDALQEIAEQSGVKLSYSQDLLPAERRVSLNVKNVPALDALRRLAVQVGLRLTVKGDAVVITRDQSPAPPPSTESMVGTIAGRVTDATSGTGLAAVDIMVEATGRTTLTETGGEFRIVGIPAGAHTVTAERIGYASASKPVDVQSGETAVVDFALRTEALLLDEVVVAGTVVQTRRRELPVPVATISEEKLQTPSRNRLDRLFRGDIPGIIGIEGHPTQSGAYVFVRGRSSLDVENLIKVYVDGVELPSTTLVSSIDLRNLERVELLRGPQASTIYGSNASGGVLLIFTKQGSPGGPRLSGSASVGITNSDYVDDDPMTMEHRLNLSGGVEGFTYSLGGSYNSTGEWIEQGSSRQAAFNGRGTFTQGPWRFSLTSTYSNRVLGLAQPPGAAVLEPVLPDLVLPNNTDITTSLQLLGASATYAPSGPLESTITLGWNGITDRFEQYAPQRAFPDDTTYNRSLQAYDQLAARLHLALRLAPSSRVSSTTTAGIELSRSSSEYFDVDLYSPDGEFQEPVPGSGFITPTQVSKNQGYFVQEVLGIDDRLFLTAAVRAEHNSNFGRNHEWVWAPRFGLAYLFEPALPLSVKPRVSYGKSLRPPQPGQSGSAVSPTSVQRPNPNLRPELQRGFDVGFDLELMRGRLTVEATYFDQTAADLIDQVVLSYSDPEVGTPTILQYQNVGEVANRGVELGLRSRLGIAEWTATYTYTSSEVRALADGYGGELEVGDQPTYVPQHTAGGSLALNLPWLVGASPRGTRVDFGATYIGERTSEDRISLLACIFGLNACVDDSPSLRDYWVTLPGFFKLRAGITQPLSRSFELFVDVDNLTNRQHGEFFVFSPSRGRTVLIGGRFGA